MAENVVEYILKINARNGKVELKKLTGDLKKTQKGLDKTGTKGQKAMRKLALGAKKAKAAMSALSSGLGAVGLAATAAGVGIFALAKGQADYVNQLNDSSTRTGIAIKTLAGLKLAAEGSGKSFESVERGLDRFIPKLAEASDESSRSGKFFKSLGVSVKDANGQLRSGNAVFNDTLAQLSKIGDQTTQNAFAFEVFGRQAGGALIQSGALKNMDQFVKRAEELGPALDENGIKKAAEFQKGWTELKTSVMGSIGDIFKNLTGDQSIGKAMSTIAGDMKYYAEVIVQWFEYIGEKFKPVVEGFMLAADIMQGKFKIPEISGVTSAPLGPGYGALNTYSGNVLSDEQLKIIDKDLNGPLFFIEKAHEKIRKMDKKIKSKGYELYPDLGEDEQIARLEKRKTRRDYVSKKMQIYKDMATRHLIDEHERNITAAESTFDEAFGKILSRDDLKVKLTKKGGAKKPGDIKPFVPGIPTTGTDEKAAKKIEEAYSPFDFIEPDMFDLPTDGFQDAIDIFSDVDEKWKSLIEGFEDGTIKIDEASLRAENLKDNFEEVGYSTDDIDKLIDRIDALRKETEAAAAAAKRLSDIEFGIGMAGRILDVAGGDVAGGVAGAVGMVAPQFGGIAGGAASILGGLEALGQQLANAENAAVDKHIAELVNFKEVALGRKLTEDELKGIENSLSTAETKQIKEEARTAMMKSRMEDMVSFVSLAITELPGILIEVLPPMLLQLAANIVHAIFQLPGRIIGALGKGVVDWFKMLGQIIADIIPSANDAIESIGNGFEKFGNAIKGFFGMDNKRQGGRFISARSGIRFTGGSDQMAQLHRNEFVVPESGARPQGINRIMNENSNKNVNIYINAEVVQRDAIDELVRRIERQFQTFGNSTSTLFG